MSTHGLTASDTNVPYFEARPLLQDFLRRSALALPEKVALVAEGERWTYAGLWRAASSLASTLARSGVERGDRVIVFADNSVETVVSFFGALAANAVPCVLSPQTKAQKLAYLIGDCTPAAIVVDARLAHVLAAAGGGVRTVVVANRERAPRYVPVDGAIDWADALASEQAVERRCIDVDLASIVYTSGSTGDPKGVMLTHRNMLTAAASVSTYLGNREDDVILCALPLSFDYGLYQMLMAFREGARLVLMRSFAYPAKVLAAIEAERVTGFPGVPTVFAMLGAFRAIAGHDLSSVRYVTNTADALQPSHIEAIRRVFPGARIFSMYGLTECKRVSFLPPEDLARKPGSVGLAIPNTELRIVDEQGREVGPNVVGQLVVRGATVMRGYWRKPEATARKLRPGALDGEQVLYTGDLCRMDEEGYLYFVARMDEVIKSRGEKVAPKEVERALLDIPGVREAAVIGVPDELLGQAVKAFVALHEGAVISPEEIRRESRSRLEAYMVPMEVVVLPALPRGPRGKVLYMELR